MRGLGGTGVRNLHFTAKTAGAQKAPAAGNLPGSKPGSMQPEEGLWDEQELSSGFPASEVELGLTGIAERVGVLHANFQLAGAD